LSALHVRPWAMMSVPFDWPASVNVPIDDGDALETAAPASNATDAAANPPTTARFHLFISIPSSER
jgi:hypothetical protein